MSGYTRITKEGFTQLDILNPDKRIMDHLFRSIVIDTVEGCKNGWRALGLTWEKVNIQSPRALVFYNKENYCTLLFSISDNSNLEIVFYENNIKIDSICFDIVKTSLREMIDVINRFLIRYEEQGSKTKFSLK